MSVHYPETMRRYMHYRKKNDFVVIKYGAEWCGPCKKLTPVMSQLAKEHDHVYFLDVDVENDEISEHPDLSNVGKIPHIKFFVDGKLEREIVGLDLDSLNRYVNRYSDIKLKEKQEPQEDDKNKLQTFQSDQNGENVEKI